MRDDFLCGEKDPVEQDPLGVTKQGEVRTLTVTKGSIEATVWSPIPSP